MVQKHVERQAAACKINAFKVSWHSEQKKLLRFYPNRKLLSILSIYNPLFSEYNIQIDFL